MADEVHPLLQSVVINCMLEYVPKSMWRTCRLVCKPWHEVLLPRWRKQTKVRIGGLGESKLSFDDDSTYSEVHDVTWFVKAYQSNNDVHQFEKRPIRFMKTISGQVTLEPTQIQRRFWNLCGPWLYELHFHGVMFKHVDYLKDIIFKLTPNLQRLEFSGCDVNEGMQNINKGSETQNLTFYKPSCKNVQANLKVLKISSQTSSKNALYRSKFPVNFLNIFSVFTNIEELSLEKFYSLDMNDGPKLTYILDVIRTIRESPGHSKLNIKKLHLKDMGMGFTPALVAQLCALSLPLEDLEVLINNNDRCLEQLLSKYSTLKKLYLKIFNCEPLNQATFDLRVLPETLTELSFNGLLFKHWSFLAFTPNLTKLIVNITKSKYMDLIEFPGVFPMNRTPLLKFVTRFVYKTMRLAPVPAGDVEMLTRIMPNVTELTLNVDCDGFPTVCDNWTKLTSWEIVHTEVDEPTFIANISKLKCLTYLGVNVADNADDGREMMEDFGDNSIENGFLTLPNLQKLSITILRPTSLTNTWLKNLYDKVPDTDNVYIVHERFLGPHPGECKCRSRKKVVYVKEKIQLKDVFAEDFAGMGKCQRGFIYHNIPPTRNTRIQLMRQGRSSPYYL